MGNAFPALLNDSVSVTKDLNRLDFSSTNMLLLKEFNNILNPCLILFSKNLVTMSFTN